jgi:uncharacterized membrane protein YfcA
VISTTTRRLPLIILVGLAAGLLAGIFGVGGGIIVVPLLMWMGFDRHSAHATSLTAIVPIALAGAVAFGIGGAVDPVVGVAIGLGGLVGSAIGASVMHRSSPKTLTIVFACVLLLAGVRMVLGGDPIADTLALGEIARTAVALAIGMVAGFFAGLSGVGGGVIIVPAAVFFLGLDQHAAEGTSLVAIIFTALSATVVNLRNRRVRLGDGLVIGLGGVAGSIAGARVALGTEEQVLSVVFGCLVLLVAVQTLWKAVRSEPV